ncbi:hypothetical protein GA0115246_108135 [Streptomyces sp. SolWspMP-sol7th]|nr:hypothetical protein GA0115246_108135 [Streptomyces sp. SolWspMP-sol7th]
MGVVGVGAGGRPRGFVGAGLPGSAMTQSVSFLARLGCTREGSPGIFG